MKLSTLQKRARQAFRARGHGPVAWQKPYQRNEADHVQSGSCTKCGQEVHLVEKPMPNEIDIGGAIVAVNCPGYSVRAPLTNAAMNTGSLAVLAKGFGQYMWWEYLHEMHCLSSSPGDGCSGTGAILAYLRVKSDARRGMTYSAEVDGVLYDLKGLLSNPELETHYRAAVKEAIVSVAASVVIPDGAVSRLRAKLGAGLTANTLQAFLLAAAMQARCILSNLPWSHALVTAAYKEQSLEVPEELQKVISQIPGL